MLCVVHSSVCLKRYDRTTTKPIDNFFISELAGQIIHTVQSADNGNWILQKNGDFFFIDNQGNVQEKYQIPSSTTLLHDPNTRFSISPDGQIIEVFRSIITVIDPRNNFTTDTIEDSVAREGNLNYHRIEAAFLTPDNKIYYTRNGEAGYGLYYATTGNTKFSK